MGVQEEVGRRMKTWTEAKLLAYISRLDTCEVSRRGNGGGVDGRIVRDEVRPDRALLHRRKDLTYRRHVATVLVAAAEGRVE